jgi:hypothetical protein
MSRRERIVSARSDDLLGLSGRRAPSCGLFNTHDLAVICHADRVAGRGVINYRLASIR